MEPQYQEIWYSETESLEIEYLKLDISENIIRHTIDHRSTFEIKEKSDPMVAINMSWKVHGGTFCRLQSLSDSLQSDW